eukprot:562295-Rhodomonas_salina.6
MSRQRDYISTVVTDHPLRHPTLTRVYGFGLRLGPRGSGFEVVGYQRSGFLIWCLESDLPRKGRGSSPQPPPREHLEPPATPIYDVKAGNHAAGVDEIGVDENLAAAGCSGERRSSRLPPESRRAMSVLDIAGRKHRTVGLMRPFISGRTRHTAPTPRLGGCSTFAVALGRGGCGVPT